MSAHAAVAAAVRPVAAADLERVALLLGATYGLDAAAARRLYAWKYLDLDGRDTGRPAAFLAEDDEGPAGFLGCLPFTLRHAGRDLPAGWVADWHLLPRARGLGIGSALLRAALDAVPALGSVDVTADAARAFDAAGFTTYEPAAHWQRVLRPLAFEWPRRQGLRRALGLVRAAGHALQRPPAARAPAAPWTLEALAPGAPLPAAPIGDGPVRDAGYLRWLARCPGVEAALLALRDARGDVRGHALLHVGDDRIGRRRGRVLALAAAGAPAELAAAYAAATGWCAGRGAAYVELVAPHAHAAALRAAGFGAPRPRRLWLRTPDAAPPDHPWSLALADKDDAFRGAPGIP